MNKETFHRIFEEYYQSLCRFAYVLIGCKETADDVVQKAFISFWESRFVLPKDINTKSYLYKTVRNLVVNHQKSEARRGYYEQDATIFYYDNTDELVDKECLTKHLKNIVDCLPPKCKVVYTLKYQEGLTYQEISEYLEISTNTVSNHIQKALRILKEYLTTVKDEIYTNQ